MADSVKLWTRHHRALLSALRAETLVPKLIGRLSLERCAARDDDTRLLRGWVASLRADPGWCVLEPYLDRPRAFPDAWRRAVDAGFSARSDHHHALLFERFCRELVEDHDFEVAHYAWRECVEAWLRVFESDYVDDLLDRLSASAPETRQKLLVGLADARAEDLREGLNLEASAPGERFHRRRTRFGWDALSLLERRLEETEADHPALDCLAEHVQTVCAEVRRKLLSRFGALVADLDLADAEADTISRPFEWVREVFTILPIDSTVAARVVDAAVDVCWKLRKLELDDSDELMEHLLLLASPFNQSLAEFIESGEAFGHNSTCADFLVFQGEQQSAGQKREAKFERALEICPGHRNAAMMLSYERLREVSDLLLRLRMMPAAVKMLPGASERVGSAFENASSLLDDAESLYPANENIAEYRQEVAAEAERLGAVQ